MKIVSFSLMFLFVTACNNHLLTSTPTEQSSGGAVNNTPQLIQGFSSIYFSCESGSQYTLVQEDGSLTPYTCDAEGTQNPGAHMVEPLAPAWAIVCPAAPNNKVEFSADFIPDVGGYWYYIDPCTPGEVVDFNYTAGEWVVKCPDSGSIKYLTLSMFGQPVERTESCTPGNAVSRYDMYSYYSPAANLRFSLKCDSNHLSYGIRFTGSEDATGQTFTDDQYHFYDCNQTEDYTFSSSLSGSAATYIDILKLPTYTNNIPD